MEGEAEEDFISALVVAAVVLEAAEAEASAVLVVASRVAVLPEAGN